MKILKYFLGFTSLFWLTVLILVFYFHKSIFAQTIVGNVYDITTKKPIPEVIVLLKQSQDRISAIRTSDAEGNFHFENVKLDEFIIQTQHLSYEDKIIKQLSFSINDTLILDIGLLPTAFMLQEITVEGEKKDMELDAAGFYTRRATRDGRFYSKEEIKEKSNTTMRSLLTGLLGITFKREDNVYYFNRYANSGMPIRFYVDGVWIDQDKFDSMQRYSGMFGKQRAANPMGLNAPPNPIEYINPLEIKAIEVYSSMMQAPYEFGGGKSPGGVVVIWTGR
ncbi:MAG: carboxypeptidase-like regulatory domain-containing protein [Ignavibacteria bacterium]|nr:carboxypeptidase-like regulatory domain-containing protein [Ignavibacteria bacterium]